MYESRLQNLAQNVDASQTHQSNLPGMVALLITAIAAFEFIFGSNTQLGLMLLGIAILAVALPERKGDEATYKKEPMYY